MDTSINQKNGFWLWHAALAWRLQLSRNLEPLKITTTQFFVLGALNALQGSSQTPVAHGMIATHAGLDPMMTSRVLQKLEKSQLITRSTHTHDKRKQLFEVTMAGRALANKASRIAMQTDELFFRGSPAEITEILQNLYAKKELENE